VARPLFQAGGYRVESDSADSQSRNVAGGLRKTHYRTCNRQDHNDGQSGDMTKGLSDDFHESVKSMHVAGNDTNTSGTQLGLGRRDRVSFDTNISFEEDSEESGMIHQSEVHSMIAVERFHERKFGGRMQKGPKANQC
jgi:hypothetical protein